MAEWIASGRILDLILLLILAEILTLRWWTARSSGGPTFMQLLPYLLSGFVLMLTVRMALTDQHWLFIAGGLFAALLTHLWDMAQRFRS